MNIVRRHGHCSRAAFSLLELLIALGLVSLLCMLAVPAMRSIFARQHTEVSIKQLANIISFARHAAIKYGHRISLCHSNNQRTCSGSWQDGLIVFVDNNDDGSRSQQEKILRTWQLPSNAGLLTWRGFRSSDFLQFNTRGLGVAASGSFLLQSVDGKQQHTLVINRLGRVRVS